MANPATTDDLESRWRPLSAQEAINGQTFLDDAWRMLRRRFPDLADDIAAGDTDLSDEAVRIMATAVLRVMKNPDGMRQESIDDYSWTRDQAVSAGLLYISDAEFDSLYPDGNTTGAYSFSMLPTNYPDSRWPVS
jgi:hypothetical protein